MEYLARNYQAVLAIIAILGVIVNFYSLARQRHLDAANEVDKRIDAASKIAKAATDMMSPLDKRVDDLEKDNARFVGLIKTQASQIENLRKQYDEQKYELRVVKADRANLLQRVLILQTAQDQNKALIAQLRTELTAQANENVQLRIQITQFEAKLKSLRVEKCEDEDEGEDVGNASQG